MKYVLGLFSYGGVQEGTVDSVLGELAWCGDNQKSVAYHRVSGDALIERSRSRALGRFMASDADVLVMIDHDITWQPGSAWHIANAAHEQRSLVGGLYCKRARGKGWSSKVPFNGTLEFGKEPAQYIETPALATGFLAIPRAVVAGMDERLDVTKPKWQADFKAALDGGDIPRAVQLLDMSIAPIADGAYKKVEFEYKDYFRCIRAPSHKDGICQFLSEDWAFSLRAVFCGYKSLISSYPALGHTGDYQYTIADGMDEDDLKEHQKRHGAQCNSGEPNHPDTQSGGDSGDVCNQRDDDRRNQRQQNGANRKASRRRRK